MCLQLSLTQRIQNGKSEDFASGQPLENKPRLSPVAKSCRWCLQRESFVGEELCNELTWFWFWFVFMRQLQEDKKLLIKTTISLFSFLTITALQICGKEIFMSQQIWTPVRWTSPGKHHSRAAAALGASQRCPVLPAQPLDTHQNFIKLHRWMRRSTEGIRGFIAPNSKVLPSSSEPLTRR